MKDQKNTKSTCSFCWTSAGKLMQTLPSWDSLEWFLNTISDISGLLIAYFIHGYIPQSCWEDPGRLAFNPLILRSARAFHWATSQRAMACTVLRRAMALFGWRIAPRVRVPRRRMWRWRLMGAAMWTMAARLGGIEHITVPQFVSQVGEHNSICWQFH